MIQRLDTLGVNTMPDLTPYIAPLLALLGTLAVALLGLYQWRKQHLNPNRTAVADAKRKAAEQLWSHVEEIDVKLRTFGADTRKIDVRSDIKALNEAYLRNSLYLSDDVQKRLNEYVLQLHLVARSIEAYQGHKEEWEVTLAPSTRTDAYHSSEQAKYSDVNAQLDLLSELRATAKESLLRHIDA